MEQKGFSVGEMVKFGWKTTWNNKLFLLSTYLITAVVATIPFILNSLIMTRHMGHPGPLEWAIFALGMVVYIALMAAISVGYLQIALKWASGIQPQFRDFFAQPKVIWNYFLSNILYQLILVVGLLLLIVPGVIWGMRYSMYGYHIIENQAGPVEALKMSAKTTFGAKWDIFALLVVNFVIMELGLLSLFVGLLVAIPVAFIGFAYAYKKLVSHPVA